MHELTEDISEVIYDDFLVFFCGEITEQASIDHDNK